MVWPMLRQRGGGTPPLAGPLRTSETTVRHKAHHTGIQDVERAAGVPLYRQRVRP